MKTTRKIVPISVVEGNGERVSAEDLAKSQWALIHDLERKYKGKTTGSVQKVHLKARAMESIGSFLKLANQHCKS